MSTRRSGGVGVLAVASSISSRRRRPVHASAEPSPRTSTPAAHAAAAQLGARRDLLDRLEAAHPQVDGLAPGPARRGAGALLEQVQRGFEGLGAVLSTFGPWRTTTR